MKKNEQKIHGNPAAWKKAFIAVALTAVVCATLFFVTGHPIYGFFATVIAVVAVIFCWQAHNNIRELSAREVASDSPAPIANPTPEASVTAQPTPVEPPVCAEPTPAEYVPRKGTRGYLRYRQDIVEDALVEAERLFSAAEHDEDVYLAEKDEYEKALAAARARRKSK